MANKFLLSITLMSFLMTPAISRACDAKEKDILEIEKTEVFSFRTADCTRLNGAQKAIQVKEFLASNETNRGSSQYYFDKGENQYGDLKDTLVFNINEEESQGASASTQEMRHFDIDEE